MELREQPISGHVVFLLNEVATHKATFNARGTWKTPDENNASAIFSCMPFERRDLVNRALNQFDRVRLYVVYHSDDDSRRIEFLVGVDVRDEGQTKHETLYDLIGNLSPLDTHFVAATNNKITKWMHKSISIAPKMWGGAFGLAALWGLYLILSEEIPGRQVAGGFMLAIALCLAYLCFFTVNKGRVKKANAIRTALEKCTAPAKSPT